MNPKQRTLCPVCGGSYDGTPSGRNRHNDSQTHRLAEARAEVEAGGEAYTAQGLRRAVKQARRTNGEDVFVTTDEVAELKKQLKARQADLRWREARREGDPNAKAAGGSYTEATIASYRDKVAKLDAQLKALGA